MKKPTKQEVNNLITELRALAPKRPLTYGESLQLARSQAAQLRSWVNAQRTAEMPLGWLVNQQAVPVHFVPSHVLNEESGLTTDLMGNRLQVFINEIEPAERQRFSLLHEWKHALDFPNASVLHQNLGLGNAQIQRDCVEWIANEFAAQVLMPLSLVKHVWASTQDIALAARTFNVSHKAMHTRLKKLGFIERPEVNNRAFFRTSSSLALDTALAVAA